MAGTRTHYHGGAGTPVVLLHGATSSWRIWAPVLPHLSEYHEVFALTMPGHNGGPPLSVPPHAVETETFVDGVARQLDDLGLDRVHLVGNSLGGRVSIELLRRGRARSVTALSPACASRNDDDMRRLRRIFRSMLVASKVPGPRALARRSPGARRTVNRLAMQYGDRLTRDEFDQILLDLAAARPWLMHLVRNSQSVIGIDPLDSGTVPVCVAWGSDDRILPWERHGEPLMQLLPDATYVRLPGCGHVPMWDNPHGIAAMILRTAALGDLADPPH